MVPRGVLCARPADESLTGPGFMDEAGFSG